MMKGRDGDGWVKARGSQDSCDAGGTSLERLETLRIVLM